MQHTSILVALVSFGSLLVAIPGYAAPAAAGSVAVTDDPYFQDVIEVRPAPPSLPAVRRRPRQRTLTLLEASVGYTALAGLFKVEAPTVAVSLGVRFPGVSERLAIRVSAFATAQFSKDEHSGYEPDRHRAFGAGVALQITWNNGFWLAPGLGFLHVRSPLAWGEDARSPGAPSERPLPQLTLPELTFGLGWELALSKGVAIQLAVQTGTALVTIRATAYAGLSFAL